MTAEAGGTVGVAPLSPEELQALTNRSPLTRENFGALNEKLSSDPVLALRVAKSLIDAPESWDKLFTLDESKRNDLIAQEDRPGSSSSMSQLIDALGGMQEDLSQVTLQVSGPDDGIPVEEAENPWYAPDAFKVEVKAQTETGHEGTTTGGSVSASLEWHF